jgi:hypothetical protein
MSKKGQRKPKRSRLNQLRRTALVRPEYFQYQYECLSRKPLFEETSDASSKQPQVQAVVEAPKPIRRNPRQAVSLFADHGGYLGEG